MDIRPISLKHKGILINLLVLKYLCINLGGNDLVQRFLNFFQKLKESKRDFLQVNGFSKCILKLDLLGKFTYFQFNNNYIKLGIL
jgi:hypothetical protein